MRRLADNNGTPKCLAARSSGTGLYDRYTLDTLRAADSHPSAPIARKCETASTRSAQHPPVVPSRAVEHPSFSLADSIEGVFKRPVGTGSRVAADPVPPR
jgi:hypothetical protein